MARMMWMELSVSGKTKQAADERVSYKVATDFDIDSTS